MSGDSVQAPKPFVKPKPGAVIVVRALFKYTARYDDELSFNEGDILYVFDRSNPQWWKARCGSQTGLIPYNYVEEKLDEIINPLHEAARRGNLLFLQECLSQNVSATALDSMGNTPLYWACHSGHTECVKLLLLQQKPPLNAQNHFGDTPLHIAAAKNHYDIVQILLEAGCKMNILNKNGETAENLAISVQMKNLLQNQMHQSKTWSKVPRAGITEEEYDDDSD